MRKGADCLALSFQTSSGTYYIYDGLTNEIRTVYNLPEGMAEKEKCKRINDYICDNYGKAGFNKIVWPCTYDEYIELIEKSIPILLLQMTCRCNLDCDYCLYSGNYHHMTSHNDSDMTISTIRESIDLFEAHNRDCEEAQIHFYGGEVLLRMKELRFAVDYARSKIKKKIRFAITTNGMLLDNDLLEWLGENRDVYMTVTLNGPYHDKHRRTSDGRGSLDIIMKNIRNAKENYPDIYEKQISFISNIMFSRELDGLKEFFEENLGKYPAEITNVQREDGNDYIRKITSGEECEDGREEKRKIYASTLDEFLDIYFKKNIHLIHSRYQYSDDRNGYICGCMPFGVKLYVHADGRFGICESTSDKMIVGDLEHGFNYELMKDLYEKYQSLCNKTCCGCWTQRLCNICLKDLLDCDGKLVDEIPESFCVETRKRTAEYLKMYCEIAERFPEKLSRFD